MFSLICVWINGWVNNRDAGDLRRYRGHYDVNVMIQNIYTPVPGESNPGENRSCAESTRCCVQYRIPFSCFQSDFLTGGLWSSGWAQQWAVEGEVLCMEKWYRIQTGKMLNLRTTRLQNCRSKYPAVITATARYIAEFFERKVKRHFLYFNTALIFLKKMIIILRDQWHACFWRCQHHSCCTAID